MDDPGEYTILSGVLYISPQRRAPSDESLVVRYDMATKLLDLPIAPILKFADGAFASLATAQRTGRQVWFTCAYGHSRSPSAAVCSLRLLLTWWYQEQHARLVEAQGRGQAQAQGQAQGSACVKATASGQADGVCAGGHEDEAGSAVCRGLSRLHLRSADIDAGEGVGEGDQQGSGTQDAADAVDAGAATAPEAHLAVDPAACLPADAWTVGDLLSLVKLRRAEISVNRGFLAQLRLLDTMLQPALVRLQNQVARSTAAAASASAKAGGEAAEAEAERAAASASAKARLLLHYSMRESGNIATASFFPYRSFGLSLTGITERDTDDEEVLGLDQAKEFIRPLQRDRAALLERDIHRALDALKAAPDSAFAGAGAWALTQVAQAIDTKRPLQVRLRTARRKEHEAAARNAAATARGVTPVHTPVQTPVQDLGASTPAVAMAVAANAAGKNAASEGDGDVSAALSSLSSSSSVTVSEPADSVDASLAASPTSSSDVAILPPPARLERLSLRRLSAVDPAEGGHPNAGGIGLRFSRKGSASGGGGPGAGATPSTGKDAYVYYFGCGKCRTRLFLAESVICSHANIPVVDPSVALYSHQQPHTPIPGTAVCHTHGQPTDWCTTPNPATAAFESAHIPMSPASSYVNAAAASPVHGCGCGCIFTEPLQWMLPPFNPSAPALTSSSSSHSFHSVVESSPHRHACHSHLHGRAGAHRYTGTEQLPSPHGSNGRSDSPLSMPSAGSPHHPVGPVTRFLHPALSFLGLPSPFLPKSLGVGACACPDPSQCASEAINLVNSDNRSVGSRSRRNTSGSLGSLGSVGAVGSDDLPLASPLPVGASTAAQTPVCDAASSLVVSLLDWPSEGKLICPGMISAGGSNSMPCGAKLGWFRWRSSSSIAFEDGDTQLNDSMLSTGSSGGKECTHLMWGGPAFVFAASRLVLRHGPI